MSPDPVRQAVERAEAASVVLDRHKSALFPHLAMLHNAFGPVLLRNIVSGAVEAVILAAKTGEQIGEGAVLDVAADAERTPTTQEGTAP